MAVWATSPYELLALYAALGSVGRCSAWRLFVGWRWVDGWMAKLGKFEMGFRLLLNMGCVGYGWFVYVISSGVAGLVDEELMFCLYTA